MQRPHVFARVLTLNVVRFLVAILALLAFAACASDSGDATSDDFGSTQEPLTAVIQVNSGGGAVSPFAADGFFSGGSTFATGNAVSTSGVTDAAPASVYQSERYGNFSYTFTGLAANAAYTVRLHFAEIYWTAVGQRRFNVTVNGAAALSNFDIFAVAGANKAVVRDISASANASGQIVVTYATLADNAKSSGIEILSGSTPPVNQAPTVATAAAVNPNPLTLTGTSATSTLSALGADDAGETNLTYTWATTGTPPASVSFSANGSNAAKNTTATFTAVGTYSLRVTIRDQPGLTVTNDVNVTVQSGGGGGTAIYRVNSGGGAVSPFAADQFFSGGNTYGTNSTISTSGVANAAPAAVYQTERFGNHSYTFGSLTPNTAYTVRLHFAEIYFSAAGQRRFDVAINGLTVLPNFDIFAVAGANKAVVRDFTVNANASGQIVITYTTLADNAKSSGVEILSSGTAPPNQPPTLASAASANPNPVTGTTTNLSVLGADDGGEANLTYTWATTGTPPAAVSFSVNGSNAAKNTTATFTKTGNYSLQATIRDAANQTVTSSVNVTVTIPSGGNTIFFDDFTGSSIDATKWSVFDRISDQSNGEVNCMTPANVGVSGGLLNGVSKFEDRTCGDSIQAPVLLHYTSWQIQQKTAPFLYGTVEVRAKEPGGIGIWPTIWMLGHLWQDSQPFTANTPGHNWPVGGWCETDIAEFWQNARTSVNNTVHFNVPGGLNIAALPFDATTRFMVYRLQWTAGSMIWSVDAEDGVGYRTLRTLTGTGVPNVAQYVVINAAIGGTGGGTPNPATFPQTFSVDWVKVTQ